MGALSGPPQHLAPHLAPHLPHINEMAPSLATYIIAQLQTMFHIILQENVTTERSSHRQKENRRRALFLPRKRLVLPPWGQDIGLAKIYCNKLIKSLHLQEKRDMTGGTAKDHGIRFVELPGEADPNDGEAEAGKVLQG